MDKNKGGSAFPCLQYMNQGGIVPTSGGMSLRDYFAAKAMQAIAQSPELYEIDTIPGADAIAANAYYIADAMLRARESI